MNDILAPFILVFISDYVSINIDTLIVPHDIIELEKNSL